MSENFAQIAKNEVSASKKSLQDGHSIGQSASTNGSVRTLNSLNNYTDFSDEEKA